MPQNLPFLRILFPFLLGIFSAIYYPINGWIAVIGILILFLIQYFYVFYKNKSIAAINYSMLGSILILMFFFFGIFRVYTYKDINKFNHFEKYNFTAFKIKIIDYPSLKFNKYRFKARVIAGADTNGNELVTTGNILCYWDTANNSIPNIHEIYWINSPLLTIPKSKNPNEFNYKQYLSYYNIYYKTYIESKTKVQIHKTEYFSLIILANKLRFWAQSKFHFFLRNNEARILANAIILGNKDELSAEMYSDFSHTGTLHVLAVSGLHVGIVFILLNFFTNPLKKIKYGKLFQLIIVLSMIWVYAIVTGLSPSVMRAGIMFSLFCISKYISVKGIGLNTLFSSAFILLTFNPFLIVNVGFQLSYCAVLGIMLIHKPIYESVTFYNLRYKPLIYIADKAWSICSISFAAQLGTFPISLYYFGSFPSYFLFSNLIIIPAIFVLVCLALGILAFSWSITIAKFLASLFYLISYIVTWSVNKVARLPFAYADGLYLNFLEILLVYIIIGMFIYWIHKKSRLSLNLFLSSICIFLFIFNLRFVYKKEQNITTVHSIKKHQVITKIIGSKSFIIADSSFCANKDAQKFHLSPMFRASYIDEVILIPISNKITGLTNQKNSITLYEYNTKYADLSLIDNQAYYMLYLNKFTNKWQEENKTKVIWNGGSKYYKNNKIRDLNLDSFAVLIPFIK